MKIKLTYADVKKALKNGFISPLNTVKKIAKKAAKAPAFVTGKIRRNAMKKINWLLDNAKSITTEKMMRRIDDAYESAGWTQTSKQDVLNFIGDRRKGQWTNIYLVCDDNNQPVKFEVNGSYWEESFVINF